MSWALYDFATSAYFSVIFTFVFATYFTENIAPNHIEGTMLWGYTISASALLIAITSPFLGAIADYGGRQKSWLMFFTFIGIISIVFLWFAYPYTSSIPLVLTCIFISNFALEVGLVFYNSFLPKLSSSKYLGRISGWAWGFGYLGGILCLIISLYLFIKGDLSIWVDKQDDANIRAIALFVSAWIIIFSIPMFLFVEQKIGKPLKNTQALKKGFSELFRTIKNLPSQKDLLIFLVARILYIDGLNALLALGGVYAAGTFNLKINDIMIFGIIINLTAGLGAALFAILDDYIGSKKTILISLICLIINYILLLNIESISLFWMIGPVIGIFVGPIQASSRAFLARLAKPEEITRMYGLYALSGKATSFLAPFFVGLVTIHSGSQKIGMSMLLPFFLIGFCLLLFVNDNGIND
tara:strand:+ start:1241 stop:2476 length:1236 start_codon:yes stop_codon:yes gene_type:complete